MRFDSLGLFWEDTDQKTEKKETLLTDEGWIEVFSGFWAEEWQIENGEDPRVICMGLEAAYKEAKGNKTGAKCVPPDPVWLSPDYLPFLDEAFKFDIPIITDEQLIEYSNEIYTKGTRHKFVYDIECYGNFFYIAFMSVVHGNVTYLELSDDFSLNHSKLKWIMESFCLIGFNSNGYDQWIAAMAVHGCSTAMMKSATTAIIEGGERGHNIIKRYKVKKLKSDHIDIIEVAPLFASLKIYGGRLNSKKMQDLPFPPNTVLSHPQRAIVRWYCVNDLQTTRDLLLSIGKELDLRCEMSEEYGVDLRSKSDAQIAEAVIGSEIEKLNGYRCSAPKIEVGTCFNYKVPHFIKYESPLMNAVLERVRNANFVIGEKGSVMLPEVIKELSIHINNSVYNMGIGGLHSSEKCASHLASDKFLLEDDDVTSFYPYIILILGLYPQHLGPNFLIIFRKIVERRVAAKDAKMMTISDSLKIVINGSFGKLGSKWSILYSPDLLIQVTLTGQLTLLMLIERFELAGIPVVSANTDGIVTKCPIEKKELKSQIIKGWERDTGFKMEGTSYKSLYSRDVNNYIAVTHPSTWYEGQSFDKRIKTKGIFAKAGLSKNPQNTICVDAIKQLLVNNIPIEETIRNCTDITKFINVRTVKGGGVKVYPEYNTAPKHETKEELLLMNGLKETGGKWLVPTENKWLTDIGKEATNVDDLYNHIKRRYTVPSKTEYLGKAIRWYYSEGMEGNLVYAGTGKKVPVSEGAKPLMELPDVFPNDVDYTWYERETYKILKKIGYII